MQGAERRRGELGKGNGDRVVNGENRNGDRDVGDIGVRVYVKKGVVNREKQGMRRDGWREREGKGVGDPIGGGEELVLWLARPGR